MTRGINLLLRQNKELTQKKTLEKLSKTILSGILLYCIATVVIFSVYFLIVKKQNLVKEEITQAENMVNSFQQKESLQTALELRTKTIATLLSEPASLYNNLVKIQKIVPPESTIELANISPEKITFKGKVSSLEQLGYFLSAIESSKNDYTSLNIGPISKETSIGYSFSFEGIFSHN